MRQPPNNFNSDRHLGVEGIDVKLWEPPDSVEAARTVSAFYRSTWGAPVHPTEIDPLEAYLQATMVAEGKALPNCLESVALTFSISGVTRATTHQLVRTRVGAGFGQQGGRDNNWNGFNFRMPQSFSDLPEDFLMEMMGILNTLDDMYKHMTNEGVPYQDARYILPMGLETALVGTYNLLSLKGTLQRRLCNRMMWETNWVARLMTDLTVQALPWVGRSLRSGCEQRGVCGSVSPMFPPICYRRGGKLAEDNPTLKAMLIGKDYDWPDELANGCDEFADLDFERTKLEFEDPNIVNSLVIPTKTLARFNETTGVWDRA